MNYKRVIHGNREKIDEAILLYGEEILSKINAVERSLEFARKHIEKYIDEKIR